MKPEDIKDEASLKAWLETQTRQVAVTIAHRAAMRVAPVFWSVAFPASKSVNLTALVASRPLLTSALASARLVGGVREVAFSVSPDEAGRAIRTPVPEADWASRALLAVDAAAKAAGPMGGPDQAARAVDLAADAAKRSPAGTSAAHAIMEATRQDAAALDGQNISQPIIATPLWPRGKNPLAANWDKVRDAWRHESDRSWQFWIDWYEAALEGRPVLSNWKSHWALLSDISNIDSEIWDKDPLAANRIISDLYSDSLKSSNALHLKDSSETKLRNALSPNNSDYSERNEAAFQNALRVKSGSEEQRENIWKDLTELESKVIFLQESLLDLNSAALDFKNRQERLGELTLKLEELAREKFVEIEASFPSLKSRFEKEIEAAISAYTAGQAIKEPVKLWSEKESEHTSKMHSAFKSFWRGLVLVGIAVCVMVGFTIASPEALMMAFAPPGCDPSDPTELCRGFSFRGLVVSGGALTLLTLLLWFVRLKMKEYLSERHLALDSRERRAFAQAYIGLVREGDVSEEAKEQRAVVYASLFRPSTDGIVKEDGGFDPSISAAISKLLAGR